MYLPHPYALVAVALRHILLAPAAVITRLTKRLEVKGRLVESARPVAVVVSVMDADAGTCMVLPAASWRNT